MSRATLIQEQGPSRAIDSRSGRFGFDRCSKPHPFRVFQQPASGSETSTPLYVENIVSVEYEVSVMAIEHARAHALPKPWGVVDLRPWNNARHDDGAIGEIWYERPGRDAADPLLLLKLLFTNQPLSIQVHPDDAFAHSIGLPSGKTEAWYVLSAAPDAKVALGLNRRLTPQTIHAIGAGLVIAELQQRSDATFRLFDHSSRFQSAFRVRKDRSTGRFPGATEPAHQRTDLPPNSAWCLGANRETWLLVLSGGARTGSFDDTIGDAVFVQVGPRQHTRRQPSAWWISWRTRAAATLRCSASNSRAQWMQGGDRGASANFTHSSKDSPNERTSGNN